MILFYGSNDNELQDSGPVAPYYIGKTIYAKVGGISGGMKSAATRKKTVDAQTRQYAKEQARLEKEQAQLEEEKQRQKDEQKKLCIDEKIAKEQYAMLTKTKDLQRIGVIVRRSDIERHINGIEHENLWLAIGDRVTQDLVVKETIMSVVKDVAAKWRENNNQDARAFTIKFLFAGRNAVSDKWAFSASLTILDAVKRIIDERTKWKDEVLPEDCTVKFDVTKLAHHMTVFANLVDKKNVVGTTCLKYSINFRGAELRKTSGAAASSSGVAAVVEVVKKNTIGLINVKVELQNGISGDVIFSTVIDVVNNMSVKTLRENVTMLLFGDYSICFEMAQKTESGSVIMYDNIAGGF